MNPSSLTLEQLQRAVQIKQEIEALQDQLSRMLNVDAQNAPAKSGKDTSSPKKGGMSPAGRERIAAAQRARWAKAKGQGASKASVSTPKRATLSSEGRAKIAAAARARWAKAKKAGKTSL
jgi:hypothetical protein